MYFNFFNLICNMLRKLLFIILSVLLNVSYASFPANDTLIISGDTLKNETTLEYHKRMKSMGFDIVNCQCIDCQKFKGNKIKKTKKLRTSTSILLNLGLLILIGILALTFYLTWMFISWINNIG